MEINEQKETTTQTLTNAYLHTKASQTFQNDQKHTIRSLSKFTQCTLSLLTMLPTLGRVPCVWFGML